MAFPRLLHKAVDSTVPHRKPPGRHLGCRAASRTAPESRHDFRAFPSWFMRIEFDRCGKVRMLNETHTPQRNMPIHDIIARMRHDGCGGRGGKVELITGIEGASSRPVRKIVLRE
jgi:hypothetical protein